MNFIYQKISRKADSVHFSQSEVFVAFPYVVLNLQILVHERR